MDFEYCLTLANSRGDFAILKSEFQEPIRECIGVGDKGVYTNQDLPA